MGNRQASVDFPLSSHKFRSDDCKICFPFQSLHFSDTHLFVRGKGLSIERSTCQKPDSLNSTAEMSLITAGHTKGGWGGKKKNKTRETALNGFVFSLFIHWHRTTSSVDVK